jgi:hypothetical protein
MDPMPTRHLCFSSQASIINMLIALRAKEGSERPTTTVTTADYELAGPVGLSRLIRDVRFSRIESFQVKDIAGGLRYFVVNYCTY